MIYVYDEEWINHHRNLFQRENDAIMEVENDERINRISLITDKEKRYEGIAQENE